MTSSQSGYRCYRFSLCDSTALNRVHSRKHTDAQADNSTVQQNPLLGEQSASPRSPHEQAGAHTDVQTETSRAELPMSFLAPSIRLCLWLLRLHHLPLLLKSIAAGHANSFLVRLCSRSPRLFFPLLLNLGLDLLRFNLHAFTAGTDSQRYHAMLPGVCSIITLHALTAGTDVVCFHVSLRGVSRKFNLHAVTANAIMRTTQSNTKRPAINDHWCRQKS